MQRIWRQMITRSLGSTPLEVTIFFSLIFLFIFGLILSNIRRAKREREQILAAYARKWRFYLDKYEITDTEAAYLEMLSRYLKTPEQKYILLVNNHVFDSCLRHHLEHYGGGEELARSILLKAGLKPLSEELKGITFMRRSIPRRRVDLEGRIAAVGEKGQGFPIRIYDLSSRGASTENPEKQFKTGEDVRLGFTFRGKSYKNITADVVRTSGERARLHLAFHKADDVTRS